VTFTVFQPPTKPPFLSATGSQACRRNTKIFKGFLAAGVDFFSFSGQGWGKAWAVGEEEIFYTALSFSLPPPNRDVLQTQGLPNLRKKIPPNTAQKMEVEAMCW
jgi:hypothetical protein